MLNVGTISEVWGIHDLFVWTGVFLELAFQQLLRCICEKARARPALFLPSDYNAASCACGKKGLQKYPPVRALGLEPDV